MTSISVLHFPKCEKVWYGIGFALSIVNIVIWITS